jgi:hypothetical protein
MGRERHVEVSVAEEDEDHVVAEMTLPLHLRGAR